MARDKLDTNNVFLIVCASTLEYLAPVLMFDLLLDFITKIRIISWYETVIAGEMIRINLLLVYNIQYIFEATQIWGHILEL